jgi:phosphopantetheine--protein transferase-like protein
MNYTVGCDIVYVPLFIRSIQEGGNLFLEKIFVPSELSLAQSVESLAGYFAIKESVIKALGAQISWHHIIISKLETGKPVVYLSTLYTHYTCEVSVAHHGEYAVAMAIVSQNS